MGTHVSEPGSASVNSSSVAISLADELNDFHHMVLLANHMIQETVGVLSQRGKGFIEVEDEDADVMAFAMREIVTRVQRLVAQADEMTELMREERQ